MQAKNIKILYWLFTILFAGLMLFSAYSSILVNEDAKKLIHDQLGYPVYFIPYTGYAKLIGVIAILIPGLKTIKEWAYAGLFFDLIGATYSGIATDGLLPQISFMLLPLTFLFASYFLYHKKMQLTK